MSDSESNIAESVNCDWKWRNQNSCIWASSKISRKRQATGVKPLHHKLPGLGTRMENGAWLRMLCYERYVVTPRTGRSDSMYMKLVILYEKRLQTFALLYNWYGKGPDRKMEDMGNIVEEEYVGWDTWQGWTEKDEQWFGRKIWRA